MGAQDDGAIPLDEIGRWSLVKLDIIRKYAQAYSRILAKYRFYHTYIDSFAGAGLHISKDSGQVVGGSPVNAVSVEPQFREYHLVEIKSAKASHLRALFRDNGAVTVHQGDCNELLPSRILPAVNYHGYRRALCLLDPYGLHLDWRVVECAGKLGTIDLLLNFPVMDMNRNVLWHDPQAVEPEQAARMTRFWGDEGWKNVAYRTETSLWGEPLPTKVPDAVVGAFRERLRKVAGFACVANPLPMRNSRNGIVYWLFLASQKDVSAKIMDDIAKRGGAS